MPISVWHAIYFTYFWHAIYIYFFGMELDKQKIDHLAWHYILIILVRIAKLDLQRMSNSILLLLDDMEFILSQNTFWRLYDETQRNA